VVGPVVAEYFNATSTTATSTFGGAVGIGTTTPFAKFAVNGDAVVNSQLAIGSLAPVGGSGGLAVLNIKESITSNSGGTELPGLEFHVNLNGTGANMVPIGLKATAQNSGSGALPLPRVYDGILVQNTNAAFGGSLATPSTGVYFGHMESTSGTSGGLQSSGVFVAESPSYAGGVPTNAYGLYVNDQGNAGSTRAFGIQVNGQTSATNIYGIALDADGLGGDITFGEGQDSSIYDTGTYLNFDAFFYLCLFVLYFYVVGFFRC